MAATISRRMFLRQVGMVSGAVVGGALIAACGGGSGSSGSSSSGGGSATTLDIGSQDDQLMYDKSTLQAAAGSKITVNFKNNSTALSHNWVLVKPGTEATVANAGTAAGESKDYIADNDPNVIAHTKLSKPGETVSVTFDAPAAGDYPYICTFPGHYVTMKGTLTVK